MAVDDGPSAEQRSAITGVEGFGRRHVCAAGAVGGVFVSDVNN
jgi:hypothetical protein